ncbi:MAG: signal peptidase II [Oscillospiraceae bacterium]|nr:signal peptidase II [Oscillospiraceae bacterium]
MRNRIPTFISIGMIAVLVGIDQLTKYWVVRVIPYKDSVIVIKGVFDFTHWHNDGAAFGILSGQQTLLILVTGVFLVGGLVLLLTGKIRSKWLLFSVTLIIAGGIGNLVDRISRQYVIDFIELKFINFAIFNFADMCAVIGSVLLFFVVVSDEIREYKAKKACETEVEEDEQQQLTVDEINEDE